MNESLPESIVLCIGCSWAVTQRCLIIGGKNTEAGERKGNGETSERGRGDREGCKSPRGERGMRN